MVVLFFFSFHVDLLFHDLVSVQKGGGEEGAFFYEVSSLITKKLKSLFYCLMQLVFWKAAYYSKF